MSILQRFLKGFWFRSSHPSFEEGERITGYMTGYDEDSNQGLIRVGDTVITVRNASPEMVGKLVTVEINTFYNTEHRGMATFVSNSKEE